MKNRKIYDRTDNLKYTAKEISLMLEVDKALEDVLDIMFYLMRNSREHSFVILLISAENIALKKLLEKEKRDTDLVYDIADHDSICAMICQETEVDGGYHFANRIIQNIQEANGEEIYCVELEVRTSKYSNKDVVIRTVDSYLKAKHEEKRGEVIFKTIY